MGFFGLLWQILAFAIMTIFKTLANVADEIMFTIEDYKIYGNTFKFLSFCISSFYFWQALTTIGFCYYLLRLADKFPAPPTIAIDASLVHVGPSLQQSLEEKETALKDAASKNSDLDQDNAGLRAKVDCLQKDVDSISKDRYALVRENCILQNRLGDFNSWPEFRVEYDELAAEFEVMKRQRAREHISQEQVLHIAKEAKLELAAAKRAEAMRKIDHSEELKQVQQERDEAKERYQALLAKTTAAITTATVTTATVTTAAATTAVAKGDTPGDIALQEEITRLNLALRSQTSLLSKKSSDLDRMQSLLKTRSNHSASQLKTAASTISSLQEDKAKGVERIAELEKDVKEANEKAEEMEEMYMAVAFMDEGDGEKEKEEEKEEDEEEWSGEEKVETSRLLKQVAMSKKGRKGTGAGAGGSGTDGSEIENEDDEEEEDYDGDDDDDDDDDDDEGEGEEE